MHHDRTGVELFDQRRHGVCDGVCCHQEIISQVSARSCRIQTQRMFCRFIELKKAKLLHHKRCMNWDYFKIFYQQNTKITTYLMFNIQYRLTISDLWDVKMGGATQFNPVTIWIMWPIKILVARQKIKHSSLFCVKVINEEVTLSKCFLNISTHSS